MLRIIRNFIYLFIFLGVLGVVIAFLYALKLEKDYNLSDQELGGALWAMPARVYARPLELYIGAKLTPEQLENELKLLGYTSSGDVTNIKQYKRKDESIEYYADTFTFWDVTLKPRRMRISFANGKVTAVENLSTLENVILERLEPLRIANIYPSHNQDRILMDLDNVPDILVDGLLAVEDQNFWHHPGIDPKGIIRSVYITMIKKSGYQGASTITQQFVKNHYLTNERTLSRKVKEALMALVIEYYSTKEDILEGYLNEIYLGQDGQRAIHGFGLASEYYFNKELKDLGLHEVAMLIALVREPGHADPLRHPEYALARRNLMLDVMHQRGLINSEDTVLAQSLPLDVVRGERHTTRILYPAFVDLVLQQLYQHYNKGDLTKEGLSIFTTLDPQIQHKVQSALSEGVAVLEKRYGLGSNFLQAASVVVNSQTGEVIAVIGSRVAGEQGFNRAISAKRQVGSTIKPAVYLSALEYPQLYTLATMLDDSPLNYNQGGERWAPKNYSKNSHGQVMLMDSLIKSYNVPTARIALDLGIDDIISTLRRLGARDNLPPYPSLSLGAVEMSPLEMAQIYETFANGGYYTPLRTIREITTLEGEVVDRFPMTSIKAIEPTPYYLILKTMQEIPRRGTAASMKEKIPASLNIAGKTGTTDDYRDSWFAGFSGNILNVVWVGNDQNKPTRLSGSKGGLRIWMDTMKNLPLTPLNLREPEGIVIRTIDRQTGALAGQGCDSSRTLDIPFIAGSEPTYYNDCYTAPAEFDYDDLMFGPSPSLELQSIPLSPPAANNEGNTSQWFNN
ncbi:MAG: penicillin-binding protein 1B [Cardiobacteriales bacterium]|nr:MAG: penicillin-binding protein 1B [Cardiobacteriales bacterium]